MQAGVQAMSANISLFKNSRSNIYYIQYWDHGIRKQISTRCHKKADALHAFRDFDGKATRTQNDSITWKAYRKEYEEFSRGYHTASSHRTVIDGFNSFEKIIGQKSIDMITVREMDQYITHLKTKISIQTARKHFITLAAAFQKAVEWGYLENDGWRKVKKPTAPQTDAPFITMDEFRTVCSAVHHPEVRTIATVAFHTGMRRGEIMALRWSSIDFENRTIKIQNTDKFTTKSKKQRIVPMNGECYAALMGQQHRQTNEAIIFSVQPDLVQHQFKRACRLIFGNATKLHFHSLRHSFCSNLVRHGADIKVVQSLAGHSSIAITEKYTHYLRSDAVKAVDLLMSKEELTTRTIVPCSE
jgi:integrase